MCGVHPRDQFAQPHNLPCLWGQSEDEAACVSRGTRVWFQRGWCSVHPSWFSQDSPELQLYLPDAVCYWYEQILPLIYNSWVEGKVTECTVLQINTDYWLTQETFINSFHEPRKSEPLLQGQLLDPFYAYCPLSKTSHSSLGLSTVNPTVPNHVPLSAPLTLNSNGKGGPH